MNFWELYVQKGLDPPPVSAPRRRNRVSEGVNPTPADADPPSIPPCESQSAAPTTPPESCGSTPPCRNHDRPVSMPTRFFATTHPPLSRRARGGFRPHPRPLSHGARGGLHRISNHQAVVAPLANPRLGDAHSPAASPPAPVSGGDLATIPVSVPRVAA